MKKKNKKNNDIFIIRAAKLRHFLNNVACNKQNFANPVINVS